MYSGAATSLAHRIARKTRAAWPSAAGLMMAAVVWMQPGVVHAQVQRSIINPSFEAPNLVTTGCRVYIAESQVPGWSTNHPSVATENSGGCTVPAGFAQTAPIIELWKTPRTNNSPTIIAPDGTQVAELNAAAASRLYQNVCMVNGESFNWEFRHRGRVSATKPDVARFVLGSNQTLVRASTTNAGAASATYGAGASGQSGYPQASNGWGVYRGSFTYSGPSGETSLGFEAVSSGSTNIAEGNLLDAIQINLLPFVELSPGSASGLESTSGSVPRLRVVGTAATAFTVTVNITNNGQPGAATLGTDYTTSSGTTTMTITVPAGTYDGVSNGLFTLPITILQDTTVEGSEPIAYSMVPPAPNGSFLLSSTTSCGSAGVANGTYTIIDDDAQLSLSKNLTRITPVTGTPGRYEATYTIDVTNPSGVTANYGLTDQPGFDPDALIRSATVSVNGAAATSVNTAGAIWTLQPQWRALAAGATDTYTLRVILDVARPGTTANDTCTDPSTAGRGLHNSATATLQSPSTTFTATACETTPTPSWVTLRKTLQQRNGTDQIAARIYVGGLFTTATTATTSGSTVPATAVTATQTVEAGKTIQFGETVKVGGTGADTSPASYSQNLVCTNAAGAGSTTVLPSGAATAIVDNVAFWDAFRPAAGDDISCVITNSLDSQLRLAKTWVGGVAGDTATVTTTGGAQNATVSASAPTDAVGAYVSVVPGSVVTLPVETGTNMSFYTQSVACTGGTTLAATTPPAQITIASSSTPTQCTYTNTRRPSVIALSKTSVGDVGTFDFTLTGFDKATDSITTASSGVAVSSPNAPLLGTAGVAASIEESAASAVGYSTSYVCTPNNAAVTGNSPLTGTGRTINFSAANMVAGSAWSCVFTNTKNTTLTVSKISQGAIGTFNFTGSNGIANHSIVTSGVGVSAVGTTQTLAVPGQITRIQESSLPAGFELRDIVCSVNGGNPISVTKVINGNAGGYADISAADTAAGNDIACTFTNAGKATVRFAKAKISNDGVAVSATFVHASNGNLSGLPGSIMSATADNVAGTPGAALDILTLGADVKVIEIPAAGYRLSSATCTDLNGTATGNGTAPFAATVEPSTGLVTIDSGRVLPGASLQCTLTNVKNGSITILLDNQPDGVQVMSYGTAGTGLSNFMLDDDGLSTNTYPTTKSFTGLDPGTYSVTQAALPAGWSLQSLQCVGTVSGTTTFASTSTANINLAAGESVICTYTNSKAPTLQIRKQSDGGVDTFTFTGTNGFTSTSITTTVAGVAAAAPVQTLAAASTQTVITEQLAPGYQMTGASCTGMGLGGVATVDTGSSRVTLNAAATAPGSDIVCTFVNSKLPRLTLQKVTSGFAGSTFNLGASYSGFSSTQNVPTYVSNVPESGPTQLMPAATPITVFEQQDNEVSYFLSDITCLNKTGGATGSNFGTSVIDNFDPYQRGSRTINLVAGADVICRFTNSLTAAQNIQKTAIGGDGTFAFTISRTSAPASGTLSSSSASITTTSGAGTYSFAASPIGPLTYQIQEISSPATQLVDIQCTGPSAFTYNVPTGTATVTLMSGDENSCNFTNVRKPMVRIAKRTIGGVGSFTFTGTNGVMSTTITTTASGTPVTSPLMSQLIDVTQNTSITETPADALNWSTTWQCADTLTGQRILAGGTGTTATVPSSVVMANGVDFTCTFTNTLAPKLTIAKQVRGGANVPFEFQVTGGGLLAAQSHTLTPPAEGITSLATVTGLSPNVNLTVAELAKAIDSNPAGSSPAMPDWQVLALTCVDNPGGATGSSLVGATPTLNSGRNGGSISGALVPGADVTCTFVNAHTVTGRVEKTTRGGNGTFTYDLWVNPQTPAGPPNLSVPLTVTNATPTSPGQQSFVQEFPSSGTGTFRLQERLQAGWQLTSLGCTLQGTTGSITVNSTDLATGTLDATVAAGSDILCRATNVRVPHITIRKESYGDDGSFEFTGGTNGLPGSLILTTSGSGSPSAATSSPYQIADVTANAVITEVVPAGWTFNGVQCVRDATGGAVPITGSGSTLTIPSSVLQEGNDLTCTFTNSKQTRLTVVKNAHGVAGSFPFTVTVDGTPSSFPLTTSTPDSSAQQVINNIAPNVPITVSEDTTGFPAGWSLPPGGIQCVNNPGGTLGSTLVGATPSQAPPFRGGSISGQLVAGADVTCTFTNNQNATGRIVKTAIGGDDSFDYDMYINVTSPSGPPAGAYNVITAGGSGSLAPQPFPVLSTGNFTVQERVKAGWQLTAINCLKEGGTGLLSNVVVDVANRYVSGHVDPGAAVRCDFTNVRIPSVTVMVQSNGGTGPFTFAANNGLPASQTTTTATAGVPAPVFTAPVSNINTDAVITQTIPANWSLTSAQCVNSDGAAVTASLTGGQLTVPSSVLMQGKDLTCTFINSGHATLKIVKVVRNNNGGTAGVSAFNVNSSAGALTFTATGPVNYETTYTSQDLWVPAGTYSLVEGTVTNYVNGEWNCTGTGVTRFAGLATGGFVELESGANATCAIINDDTSLADIAIVKTNTNGGGNLISGQNATYNIVVTNNGPSWGNGVILRDTPGSNLSNCVVTQCSATGAAQCPADLTQILQPSGAPIPVFPANTQLTLGVSCKVQ